MKLSQRVKTGLAWIFFVAIGLFPSATQLSAQEKNARIYCGSHYDEEANVTSPATVHKENDVKAILIIWTEEKFPNPQERCEELSPRLQDAYNDGTLKYITNGTMDGEPVICSQKEFDGGCEALLLKLKPEDNALQILNHLKNQLNGIGVGPIKHSSAVPQIFIQLDTEELIQKRASETE